MVRLPFRHNRMELVLKTGIEPVTKSYQDLVLPLTLYQRVWCSQEELNHRDIRTKDA